MVTQNANQLPEMLTELNVARCVGMSVQTVRRWRRLGQGPKYLKIGSCVRYRAEDVSLWIAAFPDGRDERKKRTGEL